MPFLSKKIQTALIHLLFWGIVLVLPLLKTFDARPPMPPFPSGTLPPMPPNMPMPHDAPPILFVLTTTLTLAGIFYVNAYWLVPRFLFKRKYGLYILLALLSVFVLNYLDILFKFSKMDIRLSFIFGIPSFFILILSTSYRFFWESYNKEKLLQERDNEQLRSELKFLRSQISPHFLFNVLNSMVSLARKKSDLLEPSLIKLSELMQYMVYEAEADFIAVSEEVAYLKNYIELQKLRFGDRLVLNTNFEENNTKSRQIAPMLLVPLIENAFKHGTGFLGKPQIDIHCVVTNDNLKLEVKNGFRTEGGTKDKNSGIGLSNLNRRLELIYPEKHELLQTITEENIFCTKLIINFK